MEDIILFQGIKDVGTDALLGYLQAKPHVFKKGDFIWKKGEKVSQIAVILVGEVKIYDTDISGNELLYGIARDNETFGANYLCAGEVVAPVNVVAQKQTGVLFIPYKRIVTYNAELAQWQAQLIKNLLAIVGKENTENEQRLFFLEKKTIREKVLSFLSVQAVKSGAKTFEIPFSREEMASYLCVDRSALSRELSNLQKAKIIQYDRNKFTLLTVEK